MEGGKEGTVKNLGDYSLCTSLRHDPLETGGWTSLLTGV
jgi:hypothetical protein